MIDIFDFDGVLFDTVDEIATVGYCTIKNINIDTKNVPEKFFEFFIYVGELISIFQAFKVTLGINK